LIFFLDTSVIVATLTQAARDLEFAANGGRIVA